MGVEEQKTRSATNWEQRAHRGTPRCRGLTAFLCSAPRGARAAGGAWFGRSGEQGGGRCALPCWEQRGSPQPQLPSVVQCGQRSGSSFLASGPKTPSDQARPACSPLRGGLRAKLELVRPPAPARSHHSAAGAGWPAPRLRLYCKSFMQPLGGLQRTSASRHLAARWWGMQVWALRAPQSFLRSSETDIFHSLVLSWGFSTRCNLSSWGLRSLGSQGNSPCFRGAKATLPKSESS